MTKLIIFDLDGTLLDTIYDLAAATNFVLKNHGYPTHETEAFRYFIGDGIDNLVLRALPEEARTPAILSCIREEQLAYYSSHMDCLTRPYPGVEETLAAIQKKGIALAVVTNKPHIPAKILMDGYFPAIPLFAVQGQTDTLPKKPDPTGVNRIIADFGCETDCVLYCGDSGVDMMTARNAGVVGLGALWGYRAREELTAHGATRLLYRPQDILDIIEL